MTQPGAKWEVDAARPTAPSICPYIAFHLGSYFALRALVPG